MVRNNPPYPEDYVEDQFGNKIPVSQIGKTNIGIDLALEGVDSTVWQILSIQGDAKKPDHYIIELIKKP